MAAKRPVFYIAGYTPTEAEEKAADGARVVTTQVFGEVEKGVPTAIIPKGGIRFDAIAEAYEAYNDGVDKALKIKVERPAAPKAAAPKKAVAPTAE